MNIRSRIYGKEMNLFKSLNGAYMKGGEEEAEEERKRDKEREWLLARET